jgi:capsid portal protein
MKQIKANIIKSNSSSTANSENGKTGSSTISGDFIEPSAKLEGLKSFVENSSILPQCISAYKMNIAGFGVDVYYKNEDGEPTSEMQAELKKAKEIIELLNMDYDTKEIFESVIEAREIYDVAYLEVIRNLSGEIVGIELIDGRIRRRNRS